MTRSTAKKILTASDEKWTNEIRESRHINVIIQHVSLGLQYVSLWVELVVFVKSWCLLCGQTIS